MRVSETVRNDELHQESMVIGYFWSVIEGKHWTPFVKEHFKHMWN